MANHPSARKRARQITKREARNRSLRSALRTTLKGARLALVGTDPSEASTRVSGAAVALAKAASKGLLHRNTAARTTSRLFKALNRLSAAG